MKALLHIGNRIKTVCGNLRVSAGGIRLARRPAWLVGASEFVKALLQRCMGRLECVLPLSLVLRCHLPPAAAPAANYQLQVHVTPRLVRNVLAAAALPDQVRPRLQKVVHTERIEPAARMEQLKAAVSAWPALNPSGVQAGPSQGMTAVRILPVHRVIRRAVVVTKHQQHTPTGIREADVHTALGDAAVPGKNHPASAGHTPKQAAAVPMNVNHLTDQVIRAIDRRITAQRERLGRG